MLVVHLAILVGLRGVLEPNLQYAIVFVTAALWWWGWALPIFKNTPEPAVEGELEVSAMLRNQTFSLLKEPRTFTGFR